MVFHLRCLSVFTLLHSVVSLSVFSNSNFKKSDAFIGFQKDTPASVIFQATNLLRSVSKKGCTEGQWVDILKWSQVDPAGLMDEESSWEETVRFMEGMSVFLKVKHENGKWFST